MLGLTDASLRNYGHIFLIKDARSQNHIQIDLPGHQQSWKTSNRLHQTPAAFQGVKDQKRMNDRRYIFKFG